MNKSREQKLYELFFSGAITEDFEESTDSYGNKVFSVLITYDLSLTFAVDADNNVQALWVNK